MSREMNLVTMLPKINPMLAIRAEGVMHAFISGRNHLDMRVEGYKGGLWTMREAAKGLWVPVLPEGNYTVINPANYTEEKVDNVTLGMILYVFALEYLYHYAKTEAEQEVAAKLFDRVKQRGYSDKAVDNAAFVRVLD